MTELELCQQNVKACEEEIGKGIIGQKEIIRQVMLALLAGGDVLLEVCRDLERPCSCVRSAKYSSYLLSVSSLHRILCQVM